MRFIFFLLKNFVLFLELLNVSQRFIEINASLNRSSLCVFQRRFCFRCWSRRVIMKSSSCFQLSHRFSSELFQTCDDEIVDVDGSIELDDCDFHHISKTLRKLLIWLTSDLMTRKKQERFWKIFRWFYGGSERNNKKYLFIWWQRSDSWWWLLQ